MGRVDVPPGRHHVDGRTALAYVRARGGTSDFNRMARQRCLLATLSREVRIPKLPAVLPRHREDDPRQPADRHAQRVGSGELSRGPAPPLRLRT